MLLSLNRDTDLVSSIRFANLVVVGYERRPPIFLPKPRTDRSALRARGRGRARAAYAGEGPLSRPLQNCADLVSRFLSRARRRRGSGNKKRWVVRLPMVAAPRRIVGFFPALVLFPKTRIEHQIESGALALW